MPKNHALGIAQGLLVLLFVGWVTFGSWHSLPPPHQQTVSQSGYASQHTRPSIGAEERIADYTWWLAAFTCALVVVSAFQISFLFRADKTARITAEAAQKAAQATIGANAPWMTVGAMSLYEPGQPYGLHSFTIKINPPIPPEHSQVGIQFGNFGKTPAFPTAHCVMPFVGHRLPATPVYDPIIPMPSGDVIPPEGYVVHHVRNQFIILTNEQRAAMQNIETNHQLWVYGLLRYTDVFGAPHEFRFCKRWSSFSGLGAEPGFVSDSDTPAEYTKSY
jgi:hypothetical protein